MEGAGGRVVRFNMIFMNQSFDLAVKKILLVPKIELVFAESTVYLDQWFITILNYF